MSRSPRIIAHRGYAERYPENTLPALTAAADAGADAVEFDVQICRDGTPVVFHDSTLDRVTGRSGELAELDFADLREISAHEPARFGDRFQPTPIVSLEQAVDALRGYENLDVFVELKRETVPRHTIPQAVEAILRLCEPLGRRGILISFDDTVVQEARALGDGRVGWVISDWGNASRDRLETIKPDIVFTDLTLLPPPPTPLWEGPWEWAVYEVNEPRRIDELTRRGFRWIETQAVEAMVGAR